MSGEGGKGGGSQGDDLALKDVVVQSSGNPQGDDFVLSGCGGQNRCKPDSVTCRERCRE